MVDNSSIDSIITRYAKGKKHFSDLIEAGKIPLCSPGYVRGSCKNGHHFANLQFCGKEYCKDCSRDGSPIHQRRVNKWFAKVTEWNEMGYLVITIPEDLRILFYDKNVLRDFRQKALRKLKEDFHIEKGLARYHWFGDCIHCAGKGCSDCAGSGAGDTFYPHLNILFPSGYIDRIEEYLQPLKKWMFQYFIKLLNSQIDGLACGVKDWDDESEGIFEHWLQVRRLLIVDSLVVNFSYVSSESEKMNRVKYVTRSTFRRYSRDVRDLLFNFRNCVVWGWKKTDPICDDDAEELARYCPRCAELGLQHGLNWNKLERVQHNMYLRKYDNKNKEGTPQGALYAIRKESSGATENDLRDWTPILRFGAKIKRIESKL